MSGGPCPESGCQILDTITVIGQRPAPITAGGGTSLANRPVFGSPTVSLGDLFARLNPPAPAAPKPSAPAKKAPPAAAFVAPAITPVLEPIVVTAQSSAGSVATSILPTLGALGSAALISGAVFYGIGQLFDYAAQPNRRDRRKPIIDYGGGPFVIPDVAIPSEDFAPVEIPLEPAPELLPEVQVFAPRPAPIIAPTPTFYPEENPGAQREAGVPPRGLPDVPQLSPAIGRPAGRPRVVPTPRAIPGPLRRVAPGPSPTPAPSPSPAPAPSPAPGPGPSPSPSPAPSPQPVPRPIGRPGRSPVPGAPIGRLTGPQTAGVPSPSSSPAPTPEADEAAKRAGCECPGTKTKDEKKKYGCGQGYYRETNEGITYKQWSTRRCQSSKANSRSPQQGRPITS